MNDALNIEIFFQVLHTGEFHIVLKNQGLMYSKILISEGGKASYVFSLTATFSFIHLEVFTYSTKSEVLTAM